MGKREDMIAAEERSWNELHALVADLTTEDMEARGMGPDEWSVKDAMWHLGCWTAEGAQQLEAIRLGTYVEQDWDNMDELNDKMTAEGRRQDLATVKTELTSARNRALQEFGAIDTITPEVEEWFSEGGPEHTDEHLSELKAWIAQLESRRG